MRIEDLDARTQTDIKNYLAGGRSAGISAKSRTLRPKIKAPPFLDCSDSSLLVRITRLVPARARIYDGDNFQESCKQLRDTIAANLVGKKSDHPKSGIIFEYYQRENRSLKTARIVIEIYEVHKNEKSKRWKA